MDNPPFAVKIQIAKSQIPLYQNKVKKQCDSWQDLLALSADMAEALCKQKSNYDLVNRWLMFLRKHNG
jgi:hypothetical protein